MADSGQWRNLKAEIEKQFGPITGSAYRPGSKGSGGNADYHSSGNAIDITGRLPEVFEWLVKNYPGSEEIIYTPGGSRQIKNGAPHRYSGSVAAGHFDHVHWAATNLQAAVTPGGVVNAASSTSGGASDLVPGLSELTNMLSNGGMWARVGTAIGGALLLLLGFVRLAGSGILKSLDIGSLVKGLVK